MRRAKLNGARFCSSEAKPVAYIPEPANGKIHKLSVALRPTVDPQSLKALVELAREQGFLAPEDIKNAAEARNLSAPQIEAVRQKLNLLEIEIVDNERSETIALAEAVEPRPDTLRSSMDDPLSLYLNKIGEVSLLTPEQEKELCRRIERAQGELKDILYCLG